MIDVDIFYLRLSLYIDIQFRHRLSALPEDCHFSTASHLHNTYETFLRILLVFLRNWSNNPLCSTLNILCPSLGLGFHGHNKVRLYSVAHFYNSSQHLEWRKRHVHELAMLQSIILNVSLYWVGVEQRSASSNYWGDALIEKSSVKAEGVKT